VTAMANVIVRWSHNEVTLTGYGWLLIAIVLIYWLVGKAAS
jgi:hypothetical protein